MIDDELFKKRYLAGVKLKDIVSGWTAKRAWAYADKLGLPRRQLGSAALKASQIEEIYKQATLRETARQVGGSMSTVRRILVMRGVELRTQKRRLYNDETTQIIRLYRTGNYTYKQLGVLFDMNHKRIGHRVRKILGLRRRSLSS